MRVASSPSSIPDGTKQVKCYWCGALMRVTPGKKGQGMPAKQCSCGAIYCPDCYEKMPGLFGEELGPIVMIFTPIACVGYYVARWGAMGSGVFWVLGVSIAVGIGLYLGVVAPLSRIVKLAKQCPACGGRTASDWRSLGLVEIFPAPEDVRASSEAEEEEGEDDGLYHARPWVPPVRDDSEE
ncbi:MAG: hypothetical protein J7M26_02630 [Armatimonadetes bacterium]|nr:hypothetical protein [Armatimonadota bacterium]